MNEHLPTDYPLDELIFMEIEGTIEAPQFKILQDRLRRDPDALRCYVELMELYSALSSPGEIAYSKDTDAADYDTFLQVLAQDEITACQVTVEKPMDKPAPPGLETVNIELPRHRVSKFSIYTLILSTAAMIFLLLAVRLMPERPIVATLTDSFNAQWSDSGKGPVNRDVLRKGGFTLQKGLAEITFGDGAVVIVKGPSEFTLEATDQIYLAEGNLFADIQGSGGGFVVRTPKACIVDYGTEFGVTVDDVGQTESHVFKGVVDLRTGTNPRVFHDSKKLTAGQAARVEQNGQLSDIRISADANLFTRQTPSPYEVAVRNSKPLAYWRFSNDQKTFLNLINDAEYRGRYLDTVSVEEAGPDLGDGKTCRAMKLHGNAGHAIVEDIAPQDVLTGSSSVAAWVRIDGQGGQNIICRTTAPTSDWHHSFQLRTDHDGRFEFYVFTQADERNAVTSKTRLEAGRWYHLVGVVDKTRMSLYVDGELAAAMEMRAIQVDYDEAYQVGYRHINIGGQAGNVEGNEPQSRKGLDGAIAEIGLYRRALSAQEIQAIYNAAGSEK